MLLRCGKLYSAMSSYDTTMSSPDNSVSSFPQASQSTPTTNTVTSMTTATTAATMTTTTTTMTTTSTVSTPTVTSTTTPSILHNPVHTTTFKLLSHDPSIQKFGGDDVSQYSPLQFLQLCEDNMRNSNITSGSDKIAFVRSQLQPGSIAANLMSASAFNPKALNFDYQVFRSNFLQAFGMPQQPDSFQWIFDGAQSLTNNFASLSNLLALPRSAELASAAVESLKASNWITNGVLSEQKFYDIIEFLYYINFLNPSERRIASNLTYSQTDNLLDFSSKIASKLKEHAPQMHVVASTTAVSHSPVSQPSAVLTQQPSVSFNGQQRPVHLCSYCQRQGHLYKQCYRRQRHERNAARFPSAQRSSRRDSSHDNFHASSSASHRQRSLSSNSRLALQRPAKTCLIHGPGNHSSEECFKIQRLQREQLVTVSSPQSNFHQRQLHPPMT